MAFVFAVILAILFSSITNLEEDLLSINTGLIIFTIHPTVVENVKAGVILQNLQVNRNIPWKYIMKNFQNW